MNFGAGRARARASHVRVFPREARNDKLIVGRARSYCLSAETGALNDTGHPYFRIVPVSRRAYATRTPSLLLGLVEVLLNSALRPEKLVKRSKVLEVLPQIINDADDVNYPWDIQSNARVLLRGRQ